MIPQDGWTSIMIAAERGHVAVVRELLEAKADFEFQNVVRILYEIHSLKSDFECHLPVCDISCT